MKRVTFLITSLFLFSLLCFGQHGNNNGKQQIDYRSSKPYQSTENKLLPLKKQTAVNTVWTELHPLIPRVAYWGVDFINADTGWAVGEGGAIIKTNNGGEKWNWIEHSNQNVLFTVNTYNGQTVIAAGQSGTVLLSTDAGESWQTLASGTTNDLWNIQMITEDIGWLVGTGGSALKTTDGGFTWNPQPMPFPTLDYWDVYFLDENYGYISCGGGIVIKTTNGGIDWEVQQAGDNRSLFTIYAMDTNKVVAGGFAGKTVYTSDGGDNWQQLGNLSASINEIKFVDDQSGFAVTTSSTHQTTDGGLTWFYRNDIVNGSGENSIVFTADSTGYLVGGGMFLIKTTNFGNSWNKTIMNDDFLHADFNDELNGLINGSERIYKTTDGGESITVLESFPYPPRGMTFIDSTTGFVSTGHPTRIFKTTDGGENWYNTVITGLTDTLGSAIKMFFITPLKGWAVNSRGAILGTVDGGENWFVQHNAGISVNFHSIYFIDSLLGWTANSNAKPFKTTDGGGNWIEQTNLNFGSSRDIFFSNHLKGFLIDSNNLYITTNGGMEWVLDSVVIGFGQGRIGYFDTDNFFISGIKVYRTTDGGNMWTDFPELEGLDWRMYINLPKINTGYLVGNIGLIIRYTDDSIPVELINFQGKLEGSRTFLEWTTATETNNQGFWVQKKILNSAAWKDIGFVEGKGTTTDLNHYWFTDNLSKEGIYLYRLEQVDFDGSINYSSEIEIEYEFISEFRVFPNYPNPFNPTTNIKVSIPGKSHLTVELYSITGEIISTIHKGNVEGGIFNKQVSSKSLSSGVYFFSIIANEFSGRKYKETIKIVVLK